MFHNEDGPWGQPAYGWAGGPPPRDEGWGHRHHGHGHGRHGGPRDWRGGPEDWRGGRGGPGDWSGSFYGDPRGPMLGKMFRHMMRRGPFGPFGGGGGFGPGPRMFGRGDLKYALLGLLQERPKHGYEMIKELEDRSGGFYTPSAGAIYPTLQMLEDRGWVSVELVEGKKVYSISDAGKQALAEQQQRGGPGFGPEGGPRGWGRHEHGEHGEHGERGRGRRGPFGGQDQPELRNLAHQGREVAQLLRIAVMNSRGDGERLQALTSIVERTRQDLLTFLSQTRPDAGQSGQSDAQQDGPSPDEPMGGPVEQV